MYIQTTSVNNITPKNGSRIPLLFIDGRAGTRCRPCLVQLAALTHIKDIKFVAVEVTEITGIEIWHTFTRRTFICGTQFQSLGVKRIDFFIGINRYCDHYAIANGCGIAVSRLNDRDRRCSR